MSNEQLAVAQPQPQPFEKASTQLSRFLGIETGMMIETLKAQCFKGKRPDEVSDAQLAAFVSVCNVLQLNPLVPGQVYAYPERNGGITPIIGPDGTMKKLDEFISSDKLDGYTCKVFPEDASLPPTHATAVIYRKGTKHPAEYTALFREWNVSGSPTWQTKPRHMLWIRALKQAARQVVHGLPMDDEEYKLAEMVNVTPSEDATTEAPKRALPPKRSDKGVAAVQENAPASVEKKPEGEAPGQTIEAEIVEPKKETPAPVESKPVVEEKKAEPVADAEPVKTTLKVGETDVLSGARVVAVKPTPKGSMLAEVVIDGRIYDTFQRGGAKDPAWVVGGFINVTLRGAVDGKGTLANVVDALKAVSKTEVFDE